MFYKISALNELGVDVHLHCFKYGREESAALNSVCASVHYYERSRQRSLLFSSDPFIIASRRSEELLNRLAADDLPVLFEGLHCCAYLSHERLKQKLRIVRTHNIEHDYYRSLAHVESRFFKRLYFRREAKKLEAFEKNLSGASHILAISPADARALSLRYANVHHVMAFHPYSDVEINPGKGDFAFYHGNLEVGENNQAALFLVREVFSGSEFRLVIAGNNPSEELQQAVRGKKNITLRANISTAEINQLIAEAQVNVLPTFQATGIKLKLLAALFRGRFCLVNTPMVANTGVESLCVIAETASSMKARLNEIFREEFSANAIDQRRAILLEKFSNRKNAEKILELL